MMEVVPIDPFDDVGLRRFWEVEHAALTYQRPYGEARSWHVFSALARTASDYGEHHYLAAILDDRMAGVADLGYRTRDNTEVAHLEISVLGDCRRRGVGSALYAAATDLAVRAGKSTVVGGTHTHKDYRPGLDFGLSLGFEEVHSEDHFVCRLPLPDAVLAQHSDRLGSSVEAYDVVTWSGRCPDEYVAAYCAMQSQMSADVPVGDMAFVPVQYDEARLRAMEDRAAVAYVELVAVARRRSDGVFGGYSAMLVDPTVDYAYQDDTLVMPEHRGSHLGLRLKRANLDIVRQEYPDVSLIHTWSAVSNGPMQHTNRVFGFEVVEREHALQRGLR
ncbi:MAG: GNAT family N-acetyltransferase [Nocardioides sp.]